MVHSELSFISLKAKFHDSSLLLTPSFCENILFCEFLLPALLNINKIRHKMNLYKILFNACRSQFVEMCLQNEAGSREMVT